ncbi:MAG: hypothetical protein A3J74_10070 [Elusimicrobia bacterium RIFCSPHIGHO2_02_FULL_57_9]|nr:MAG: hypothetical protein A3J74_10070 [Elusimicrobia bacterium RIFCSPHIGHO2_02_FULL_57_9]
MLAALLIGWALGDADARIKSPALAQLEDAERQSASQAGRLSRQDYPVAAVEAKAIKLPPGYYRAIPGTRIRRADGTVLILRPSTGNGLGWAGRFINSASNPDGVCKFLAKLLGIQGLRESVAVEPAPIPAVTVVIDADGHPTDGSVMGRYLNAIICR